MYYTHTYTYSNNNNNNNHNNNNNNLRDLRGAKGPGGARTDIIKIHRPAKAEAEAEAEAERGGPQKGSAQKVTFKSPHSD